MKSITILLACITLFSCTTDDENIQVEKKALATIFFTSKICIIWVVTWPNMKYVLVNEI
jgi:hypothetical protein